jgi:uncharacterized protein YigA (DUF484 family)
MSLAAHFQGKTANFADLDLGTARELIDAPAEVSEPIMRRAEAGETINQEEVKAAVRISRADCVPVKRPPPAVKHVSVSRSWFAEPPTKEPLPRVDLREAGEKSANRNIAHDLKDLTFQLRRCQSADKLVERLSADEREDVRLGIEAVMRIKAALDRLGQRNAQLHKERQRAP